MFEHIAVLNVFLKYYRVNWCCSLIALFTMWCHAMQLLYTWNSNT